MFPENMFVYPGEIIDIPQYGQKKQFCVTLVEGDHGTLELSNWDYFDESLVENFASLNLSNTNASYSSSSISKCDFSFKTDDLHEPNLNKSDETSINDSKVSTYYSLCNESTHQDSCDNQACPSSMFTSTPVKVDKKLTNYPGEISCPYCSTACVSYYVTAATTKVIINESHDDNATTRRSIKEKLTYDSVGGLDKQIQTLKEILELSIKSPSLFQSYGEQKQEK